MRAVIFANGDLPEPELAKRIIQPGDLLIAADGGARHCAHLGLVPHVAVGDFDSLSADELDMLRARGVEIVEYPPRKDFTDLELALHAAQERGCDLLLVFAALGQRWDQTLANLLLPASAGLEGITIRLIAANQEITLLRPGSQATLHGQAGDTLSLIPLAGDAHGITTRGLEYSLQGETLHFGTTRGVSNILLGSEAQVFFEDGLLLCTVIHC